MRIILLIITSFILQPSFGQVVYEQKAQNTLDSVFNKLPYDQKKEATKLKDLLDGDLVIASEFKSDTLNLNDTIHFSGKVIMLDSNNNPIALKQKDRLPTLFPIVGKAYKSRDTLIIFISPNVFSKIVIIHKILNDSIWTSVKQWEKYDSVYRAVNSDVNTTDLTISANAKIFILNKKEFELNKFIYGQADIVTDDFYYLAAYGFKNQTLKTRWHFKYYFKLLVRPNVYRY